MTVISEDERKVPFLLSKGKKNLSIDESMIPYYGGYGAKLFIHEKPKRFGYKMWALTTPLGYVLQFEPYQRTCGQQTADSH